MADQDFNDAGGMPDLDLGYEPDSLQEIAAEAARTTLRSAGLREQLGIPYIERSART